jgi:transcriptional regulator with XRE-family HTH domain
VSADEFESVRAEADPLRQARRATDLLGVYQQRSVELARLRRDAINRAARERGLSFSAVAEAIGLSKGRITQIRQSAPPTERAFFGVGPVTVAIPERLMPGRAFPIISAEDDETSRAVTTLLQDLNFQVRPARIPAGEEWQLPDGDLVTICGPISSPTMARAYQADPLIDFSADEHGRFSLTDRASGQRWGSGMDERPARSADVAYVGRLPRPDNRGYMIVIGGIHAIGSLGAATWLRQHLAELHEDTNGKPFSTVIGSTHDGLSITSTEVACPARTY